jgi:hypothetical protein
VLEDTLVQEAMRAGEQLLETARRDGSFSAQTRDLLEGLNPREQSVLGAEVFPVANGPQRVERECGVRLVSGESTIASCYARKSGCSRDRAALPKLTFTLAAHGSSVR